MRLDDIYSMMRSNDDYERAIGLTPTRDELAELSSRRLVEADAWEEIGWMHHAYCTRRQADEAGRAWRPYPYPNSW